MTDEPDPYTVAVRGALADTRHDDEDLADAVVTKFAAVIEWMDPEGKRWLSLVDGDAGSERLQRWDVQGLFFNVMHDPAWHPDGDDDAD